MAQTQLHGAWSATEHTYQRSFLRRQKLNMHIIVLFYGTQIMVLGQQLNMYINVPFCDVRNWTCISSFCFMALKLWCLVSNWINMLNLPYRGTYSTALCLLRNFTYISTYCFAALLSVLPAEKLHVHLNTPFRSTPLYVASWETSRASRHTVLQHSSLCCLLINFTRISTYRFAALLSRMFAEKLHLHLDIPFRSTPL